MEMRTAHDKAKNDMQKTLRDHKDAMEKYRKEQEQKDIEFRTTNKQLVHEYSIQLDAKAREFHQKFVE